MMSKYHDIGTPINVAVLNAIKSMPIRNLQRTTDPDISVSRVRNSRKSTLLRNTACSGCPVGCIHIGYVRERFQKENRYSTARSPTTTSPSLPWGPCFPSPTPFQVLAIIDVSEKMGLDVCRQAWRWRGPPRPWRKG